MTKMMTMTQRIQKTWMMARILKPLRKSQVTVKTPVLPVVRRTAGKMKKAMKMGSTTKKTWKRTLSVEILRPKTLSETLFENLVELKRRYSVSRDWKMKICKMMALIDCTWT